ncbi:MAG: PQQ-binding-like beta-propeller repeat protein [Bacteroidetes bacterium]|nr:PQQ-binding-like beta-propeller repeat protein [Bacteroidota bacterium]
METGKKVELSEESSQKTKLRLRSGIIIVLIQWILWLVIPNFLYGMTATATSVFGGLLGGLVFLVWWAFFSRLPKLERWGALGVMIIALAIIPRFTHESIRIGMDGLMYFIYAIPVLCLALILWAIVSNRLSSGVRRVSMVLTILLACAVWTLVRSNGLSGHASADFSWRWNEHKNERLLSQAGNRLEAVTPPLSESVTKIAAVWPGFRGPNRDGIVHGVSVETDWSASPPVELWRWPIGSGCSSFAVHGTLLYTQEQSSEYEIVSCYNINTGEPVWRHRDSTRFYDQHAGAGPRSTPTLSNGRVYTLGATGILNVLNDRDGTLIWSRNAVSDTESKDSGWGFTSSPLVVEDVVIVATAGKLVAYNTNTGDRAWMSPDRGDSYSSPHLMTIDGIKQVLFMSGDGMTSFSPADGKQLWKHPWPTDTRILQPAITDDGELLISSGQKKGMRRLKVTHESEEWVIEELWSSTRIRPDFNDFVVHKGQIFGFEGPSIACMDGKEGKRMWKGNRYGGQLILLAEQDILLVLSEKGEVALVKADPKQFTELASFQAIEGKTWNHPVLVGDVLLVRNTHEVAAFRLPLTNS